MFEEVSADQEQQHLQPQDGSAAINLSKEVVPGYDRIDVSRRAGVLAVDDVALVREGSVELEKIKNLDAVSVEDQIAIEERLSQGLSDPAKEAYVYMNRNQFKLVPNTEALMYRLERLMDQAVLDHPKHSCRLSDDSIVFIGAGSSTLGKRVLHELGVKPGPMILDRFPNSETKIEIQESVRDKHAFVMMNMDAPVNEAVMETALSIQAMKLAGADRISVVLPYYAYSRQDRRADTRPPISSKAVADIIKTMGAHQIVSVDLHARQVEGFFDGPFDNLEGLQQLIRPLVKQEGSDLVIVSPDAGGSKRAEKFSRGVEDETGVFAPLVVMSKFRGEAGVPPRVTLTVGEEFLEGKTCVLVDDMIDTGGSMIAAATALKERGAARVVVVASHGIFSNNAVKRMEAATATVNGTTVQAIDTMMVTDTVPLHAARSEFIQVVSLAPLLAEAILRLDQSGSSLGEINTRRDLGSHLRSYGPLQP